MDTTYFQNRLLAKKDLTFTEARKLFDCIVAKEFTEVQLASLLTMIKLKGDKIDEIHGFVQGMRDHMNSIKHSGIVIDTCGTGGDGLHTFNISTAVAFVVAGTGVKVAKHGNKAASSKCGSADVLEHLGVNIMITPKDAEKILNKVGCVFLFAPVYHAALKPLVVVRKQLGFPTIFNFLGPFCNPAKVKRQVIGVSNIKIASQLAKMAAKLEYEHLMIVSNENGLDEIGLDSDTHAWVIQGRKIKNMVIHPKDYGFKKVSIESIKGGDAKENAAIIKGIFKGNKDSKRDIVILNSSFALKVAEVVQTIPEGMELAERSIDSGAAYNVLKNLIKVSQSYA